jgi:hypothetical protein
MARILKIQSLAGLPVFGLRISELGNEAVFAANNNVGSLRDNQTSLSQLISFRGSRSSVLNWRRKF